KKSSNTKITRQLAGIRLSANTKKPKKTQRKIKMIIIFYLRVSAVADVCFVATVHRFDVPGSGLWTTDS
ncbi:MAG TPA: hypothetical protein VGD14_21130, partial [bacterium]